MQKYHNDGKDNCTIAEISTMVGTISSRIQTIPQESEDRFLALGKSARDSFFTAKKLNENLSSLLNSVSSTEEHSISSLIQTIIDITQSGFKKTIDNYDSNREFQESIHRNIRKLNRECSKLDSSSTYFNMLSTNIKITSSGIKNAREMFGGVADSTLRLSTDIHKASDEIGNVISGFLMDQESLYTRIEHKAGDINRLSNRLLKELRIAQNDLQLITSKSESKLSILHSKVHEMSELIGSVVVSLQFHDRMRQRLEHIDEAILDAIHCMEHAKDEVSKIQAFFIIELQLEQMNEIVLELKEMKESLNRTLKALIEDVDQLNVNFQTGEGDDDIVTSLEGLNKLLEKQIEIQENAEKDSLYIQNTIEQGVHQVETIQSYLSTIDEWGYQAQFVSLNASINASKLGDEGSSLAVLSTEIVRQSENLKEVVGLIKGFIESLMAMISEKEFDHSNVSEQIKANFDLLQEGTSSLRNSEGNTVSAPLSTLKELLTGSLKDAQFLGHLQNDVSKVHQLLLTMKEALRPLLSDTQLDPHNRNIVLHDIFESYTMEEERQVHLKYFGDTNAAQTTNDNDDVDLFDDDVDLFDDDSSDNDDVELFDDDDDVELFGDDDTVELFDDDGSEEETKDTEAKSSKTDSAPVAKEDLGDNVDLFEDDDSVELFDDDETSNDKSDETGSNVAEATAESETEESNEEDPQEESEENIHSDNAKPTPTAEAGEESADEDLGDNVELF